MTDEPFTLDPRPLKTNAPPAPQPPPPRQTVLFCGLDCFPGQQDLFETDGQPEETQVQNDAHCKLAR